jgi:hypothetical protein
MLRRRNSGGAGESIGGGSAFKRQVNVCETIRFGSAMRDLAAVQFTNLNVSYLFQPIPILLVTPVKRYLKTVAVRPMRSFKAATRAISLRPLREIIHRSWYRCFGS